MGWREDRAQATVEYAVVFAALLSIIIACATVWHAGTEGVFAEIAQEAASHTLAAAGAIDISLY